MGSPVLEISALQIQFQTNRGMVKAVDGVDLTLNKGEIVGVVGESGSGKSVTSLAVMGLIPKPPGKITDGSIYFRDENLIQSSQRKMRSIRGNEIAMIFQEPMTSLNPLFTIGNQLVEVVKLHQKCSTKEAEKKALMMLKKVGITRKGILREYPHQLSGGMRQRVMIAMAMILNPTVLIADEPTTALDVTIQAQILDLMRSLNQEFGTSILLITHDLGIVAEMCDRVIVMYAGQVVEEADRFQLFRNPAHPYTAGLLQSIPSLDTGQQRLYSIPGQVPDVHQMPKGCRFAPRCSRAIALCHESAPSFFSISSTHVSRCWMHDQKGGRANDFT